jgi:hypothetical protein
MGADEAAVAVLAGKYAELRPHMDERTWRGTPVTMAAEQREGGDGPVINGTACAVDMSHRVTGHTRAGMGPEGIAVDAAGRRAFVAHPPHLPGNRNRWPGPWQGHRHHPGEPGPGHGRGKAAEGAVPQTPLRTRMNTARTGTAR